MPEQNLEKLLAEMTPYLHSQAFVFCTMSEEQFRKLALIPQGIFREEEGLTLFLTKDEAERLQIPYQNLWALITLKIHSDLLSCGFMAAVAQKLAAANIALNPVAGYFHDHLFVPYEKAEETLNLLGELSQSVRN